MLFVPEQLGRLLKFNDMSLIEKANQPVAESLTRAERFDMVNRVSYLELRNYMLNTLLRDTDSMSMAHGLEVRVPLIDHKLVEYLFTIPGHVKISRSGPKYLLVQAVKGLLPHEVVYRPKRGFTFPFEHWLRGEMRGEMDRVFFNSPESPLGDDLDAKGVQSIWQDFLSGNTSWSRPWALYVLIRWSQLYL